MMRVLKILVVAAVIVLACAYAGWSVLTKIDPVATIEGEGEYILADEFSLWHNPSNSGISYDRFEPLRVRRNGAEYFHRADAAQVFQGADAAQYLQGADVAEQAFAASGRRYSEIRLTKKDGGILYLPRWVAFDTADVLTLYVRHNAAQGQWRVSVYPTADKVAHVTAESNAVTVTQKGEWSAVDIRFDALSFEDYELKMPKRKTLRDANALLAEYRPERGMLYGLEFSLIGGEPKDSLYIDRVSLKKPRRTAPDVLTGQIVPPVRGATVTVLSDQGEHRAMTRWDGSFEISIPQGATKIAITAQTKDRVMSPRTGRFLEIGTYLPHIVIPSGDPSLDHSPAEGDSNDSYYIYEDKFGPRMEPNHHFFIQVTNDRRDVAAAELGTNRFGYIDRDRMASNPDKAYRVMVLGECHHMGVHVAQADSWWNEAEAVATMMSERPIEVISASFNHASFTSAWPAFRDLGEVLEPDLVLLPMVDPGVLNLTIEEYMMEWLGASKDHRPAYQFEFDADGVLVHKPNDPDWQLYRATMAPEEHKRIRDRYVSLPYAHADLAEIPQWVKDNIKLSVASLAEFGKLAKQRKTRFAILYISNYGSSKTELVKEDGKTYDPNKFRTLMRDMARDAGIEFLDVADELHMSMAGADAARIVYRENGHFSPYAHYRYGQALGKRIPSWMNE